MKLSVDENSDALYLRLNEEAIVESHEVEPGVILDYDKDGLVVGVELLGLKARSHGESLRRLLFQTS
jgi:uncharacterized protein YuzE